MASSICDSLVKKVWRVYDPSLAPEDKGIYCIGQDEQVIYVGMSNNIQRRLREHKSSNSQEIGKHVKKMFDQGNQGRLSIKWAPDKSAKCKEGDYLSCMEKKLGYWPTFNKQKGNVCQ